MKKLNLIRGWASAFLPSYQNKPYIIQMSLRTELTLWGPSQCPRDAVNQFLVKSTTEGCTGSLIPILLHLCLPPPSWAEFLSSHLFLYCCPCPSKGRLDCLAHSNAQHTLLTHKVLFFALGLNMEGLTIHCDREKKAPPTPRRVSLLHLLF